MRKVFALMLILSVMCVPSWGKTPDKDIVILYTNDVHCGVDENLGYAGFAFCVNEARKQTPYVTLVDAGDFAQGGTIGTISNGRYIVEIMNAIGYDIVVPGNHEFDYGWGMFENFSRNLKCGFISCNLRDLRTGELLFKPYRILKYGDVKVAFVGAITPESIVKSTPSTFMDENRNFIYDFDGDMTGEKLIASIQKAVDAARAEGADYVIVVAHLGEYDNVNTPVWTTPYIALRTKGIDAFIDGHSHEVTPALVFKNAESKDVVITQSGTKLTHVGKLTISTEGKVTTELLEGFDGRDEVTTKIVDNIKERFEGTMKQHLTSSSFDLPARDVNHEWLVRNGETNLADLAADAFLASVRETKTMKADIAFVNGGALRTNISSGDITYKNALDVLPFVNTMCVCEVKGQTILDELEVGARLFPIKSGGFLQVAGMTYTIDATIESPVKVDERNRLAGIEGKRRIRNVRIKGEVLDPEKVYKVAATNYVLLEGGDGHVFSGAKIIEANYMTDAEAFAHYLRDFQRLPERYRNQQGRIRFITK
ncbi:MAG: bifunctional metallophosphatase/5'-nucleotidase [Synergistaceae bacterium]|nr:bifunctional metallophosphatase/5'-nucleotidase [Synergistaceae bacterium]MBQ3399417.1 bifunctional metallophosphatase/5'-nucleotidase [Synergistaceae bacterium]MBQ4400782.1 bifunctional metallophosphatase/5'-nucleotidase [Synergistaceae bacterium]MBQ6001649.1 bifunctional metallophosphatase/5'-nucleotidase [Synergistaceae bacterium]MBQ6417915.1 bifunctional metallophosphatase/5'-nucleotidase [Synergistaceae bacterium]